MKILIVGATGATGRLVTEKLINHGHKVKALIRSSANLPESLKNNKNLSLIISGISEVNDNEIQGHVNQFDAIISCLGHNLTLKGIYGQPRRLVTDATRRICEAIVANNPDKPLKFILMNTTGNRNRDLPEPISPGHKAVLGLIRLLVPPHADNEKAADYLRTEVGQNNRFIEWVAVRPDTLINEKDVTEYEVFPSPIRSAIFDAGKTSRINVAHFMAELINEDSLWKKWKGQMPVIYNKVLNEKKS